MSLSAFFPYQNYLANLLLLKNLIAKTYFLFYFLLANYAKQKTHSASVQQNTPRVRNQGEFSFRPLLNEKLLTSMDF